MITTLCRYDHLVRCIESLKKNTLACETELYIGLDYPLKDNHWDGYIKISEYLDQLDGFKKINIIKHEKNVGAALNAKIMRELAWKKYDRYIVSEDDNEFSDHYLDFMNYIMDQYDNDSEVIAVTGYNYPLDVDHIVGDMYNSEAYFSAFGYGIWRKKREEYDKKRTYENFLGYYKNKAKMKELFRKYPNQFCNFVKGFLGYTGDLIKNDGLPSGDIAYGIYMFFEGKKMIFPLKSMVRNWGYDGSGIHCYDMRGNNEKSGHTYKDFNFSCQNICNESLTIPLTEISAKSYEMIIRELNRYFQVDTKERIISYIT